MCHRVDCGCGHHAHHAPQHARHHGWGRRHAPGYIPRRYPTREEIIGQLEEYLKQLQAEARGVEERIAELKKTE